MRNICGMITLMIVLVLVVTSCNQTKTEIKQEAVTKALSKEYTISCVYVGESLSRCENKEVICYQMGNGFEDGHTSCKFKEK